MPDKNRLYDPHATDHKKPSSTLNSGRTPQALPLASITPKKHEVHRTPPASKTKWERNGNG